MVTAGPSAEPVRKASIVAATRLARVSGRFASAIARACSLRCDGASASNAALAAGSASSACWSSSGIAISLGASSRSITACT